MEGIKSWEVGIHGSCCWVRPATAFWPSKVTWPHGSQACSVREYLPPTLSIWPGVLVEAEKTQLACGLLGQHVQLSHNLCTQSLYSGLCPQTHPHRYPDALCI